MKQILQNQILRLAKIYVSKPVSVDNLQWHVRVGRMQCEVIKAKKSLKK